MNIAPGLEKNSCEWSYGPVIFHSGFDLEIYSLLKDFFHSKNFVVKGWAHPLSPGDPEILQKYFQIKKWGTFLINLEKTKDEVFQSLDKHSCQKNIERSTKRGVKIINIIVTIVEKTHFINEIILNVNPFKKHCITQ